LTLAGGGRRVADGLPQGRRRAPGREGGAAVFDSFLKIEGIPGESRDSKHKDEIEVLSFSFGATSSGSLGAGGGGGAGKVNFQDFHFVHRLDKASPNLLLACANGKHYKEAVLTLRKAGKGQLEYLKIKLTEVLVSSYQLGGSAEGGESVPMGEFSLAFGRIRLDYSEQSATGKPGPTTSMEWDVKANKGK
jgi:type VI secretion system secreted protein Hcp